MTDLQRAFDTLRRATCSSAYEGAHEHLAHLWHRVSTHLPPLMVDEAEATNRAIPLHDLLRTVTAIAALRAGRH